MFGNLYNVSVWGKIDLNTRTKAEGAQFNNNYLSKSQYGWYYSSVISCDKNMARGPVS